MTHFITPDIRIHGYIYNRFSVDKHRRLSILWSRLREMEREEGGGREKGEGEKEGEEREGGKREQREGENASTIICTVSRCMVSRCMVCRCTANAHNT